MASFVSSFLALLATVVVAVQSERCEQGRNCKLPDCFCPTFKHPLGNEIIPQIVYFGFDDSVNPTVTKYYDKLFVPTRRNPNGCPITMSLYVSNKYTQYGKVNRYFHEGHEIADHSLTHTITNTAKKLRHEAEQQKENLMFFGGVPGQNIRGWRSPDLKTAGDAQPEVLKELGFTYDISLPYIDNNDPGKTAWPFTLDYGYPYGCTVKPCPGKNVSHKGFWEVPVNTHYDGETPCNYIDACRPKTEEKAYEFLMNNFLKTYNKHKAPFGLSMHAAWFYTENYMKAMDKFIDTILKLKDVYIVNVQQMLAWMKTPKTIYESKTFKPWDCEKFKAKNKQSQAREDVTEIEDREVKPHKLSTKPWYWKKMSSQINPFKKWVLQHKRNMAVLQSSRRKHRPKQDGFVFRAAIKN